MRRTIAVAAVVCVSAAAGAQTGVNGVSLADPTVSGSGFTNWTFPTGFNLVNSFVVQPVFGGNFALAGSTGPGAWFVDTNGGGSTGGGVVGRTAINGSIQNGNPSGTISGSAFSEVTRYEAGSGSNSISIRSTVVLGVALPLDITFVANNGFSSLSRIVPSGSPELVAGEGTFSGRLQPGNYLLSIGASDSASLISPGATRRISSTFTLTLGVPGPGSGAAVMMAGLVLLRRRR